MITQLVIMGVLLALVFAISWGLEIKTAKKDRRGPDFYRAYNEQEDRTETMFDRRDD